MGYIARPSRRHKTPRVYFRARGVPVSLPGFRDAASNRVLLRNCELLASIVGAGGDLSEHLLDWLHNRLEPKLKAKLVQFGLLTEAQVGIGKPILEHIDAWRDALTAMGKTPKHAVQRHRQARVLCGRCGFAVYADIQAERAMAEYGAIKAQRCSRTAQQYLGSLKALSRWMVKFGRATRDPLAPVSVPTVKESEVTIIRQVLTPFQQVRLIDATLKSRWKTHRGAMDGPERALLYRLTLATGLRSGSLRGLTRASFDLTGNPCSASAVVKRGKLLKIAIVDPKLIMLLRRHLLKKLPAAPAFNCPKWEHFSEMFRRDYKRAGIEQEHGKRLDFHALRTTFATTWANEGRPIEVLQEIMGHDSLAVTRRYYVRVGLDRQAEAMGAAKRA